MPKLARYSVVALVAGLLCIEFLVVPYTFFSILAVINDVGYFAGLAVLSLPRVLAVLLLALLIRRFGGISLVLAGAIYACILALKFTVSETYIQPNNLYAATTAIAPYVVGWVALILAGWLLWPRSN